MTNTSTTSLNVVAPACNAGDILIAVLINKSVTTNTISPPDGTWTQITQGINDCTTAANDHEYAVFWKRATASGGTFTFTKATDDNLLFAGVIGVWRGVTTGAPLDATSVGVTKTAAEAANVTFPAFDPTGTSVHVVFIAFYGNDSTTFAAAMSNDVNPDCTKSWGLETTAGNDCSLAATSGNNDGSNIASRTWASAASTNAGSTGVVFAFTAAVTPDIVAVDSGPSSADRVSFTTNTWYKASDVGGDDQVSFTWTASGGTYYYEYNQVATDTIDGTESNTTNNYVDAFLLTEGTYYFHVKPYNDGLWGTERTFIIKYDKTEPTTTFSSTSESGTGTAYTYPNGQTVYFSSLMGGSATQITITVTAGDGSGSGINYVEFGAFNDEIAQNDNAAPYERTYNITSADNGGTITVTAYDGLGYSDATPVQITMTKDTTAPTAGTLSVSESSNYLYSLGANFYYSAQMAAVNQTATFSIAGASDADSGLQYITFPAFFGEAAVNDPAGPYSEDYLINNADTDTGSFTATTMDNVGNSTNTNTITVVKDTTAPTAGTLSVSESSNYLYSLGANFYYSAQMAAVNQTATFSIAGASDADSGLQYITFPAFFGEAAVNDPAGPYSEDYLINNADTDTGSFTATTMDNVGNSTNTNTITVTKDTASPTLSSVACYADTPGDNAVYDNDTTVGLQWTESDGAGSGIGSVNACIGVTPPNESVSVGAQQDTDTGSQGANTYYVQAIDNVGNESTIQSDTITIDTVTPDIVAADSGPSLTDRISFTTDTWYKASDVGGDDLASFTWTDPNSASDDTFYYEYNQIATDSIDGTETNTANNYIDNIALSEGTYYFHVKPKNGTLTWGVERIFIFKYDKSVPVNVGSNTPANTATGVSTVSILTAKTATDSVSGLHTTPYYIELATNIGFTQNTQNSGWDADGNWQVSELLGEITYYWRVKVRDAAGNESILCGHTADVAGYGSFTTAKPLTILRNAVMRNAVIR
ncbi:MAG: hypothetical protein AAB296_10745 [Candidatus Desantisbacteria bacterium]